MADFTGIAAVTRTLAQLIQDAINRCEGDIARATVTASRPDRGDPNPQPRVNLFMFHAAPNAFLRNEDLPLRTQDGLIRRPVIALDLFYLISFYGNDDLNRIEPQMLMGVTMSALNAQPIVGPAAVRRAAAALDSPLDPRFPLQQVELSLQNMSIEELSRLWSTFPLAPYVPSVCYRASAVMIEADEVPVAVLPVRAAPSAAVSGPVPIITGLRGDDISGVTYGGRLEIEGLNLLGNQVTVVVGGATVTLDAATAQALTVRVSGEGIAAGLRDVRVLHDGVASSPARIAVIPQILSSSATLRTDGKGVLKGRVSLTLRPSVQPDQTVILELFPVRSSLLDVRRSRSYRFAWVVCSSADTPPPLAIPVDGIAPGSYLLRVSVDGAASLLTEDSRGRYIGPLITLAHVT